METNTHTLAALWKDLWNGRLDLAAQIIAEDFVAHAAPFTGTGPDTLHGRDALTAWIAGTQAVLAPLRFTVQVGPIAGGDYFAVRWEAQGTYGGGFPGAAPEAVGRKIVFTGTDILRVARGLLAEYWVNSDTLLFLQQLGVRELPVLSVSASHTTAPGENL